MQVLKIDFDSIPQLSKIDKSYTKEIPELHPFYQHAVDLYSFQKVIDAKQGFDASKRQILVSELTNQYHEIEASASTLANVELLKEPNSFTIITAHQPNLFTGPLYLIYKVVSVINLCKKLKTQYPLHHFVPVFWTGGEDHDFEEVNHLYLFGKKVEWTDQQGGSVGAYNTQSLQAVLAETLQILGDGDWAKKAGEKLKDYYSNASSYGLAHRQFLNWIFGDLGLVICNANNKAFKQQMIPVFEDELLNHNSKKILDQTALELESAGFGNQAHPREINLFYLGKNQRNRIVKEDNQYKVLDTNLAFSEAEILEELNTYPEKFSPNVIIRPLFQETIFPNLAYIGGGGEIAYWLERKKQFQHFGIPFPMLIRRCSVLWVDKNQNQKLEKLAIKPSATFLDTELLLKSYVLKNSSNELSLHEEQDKLKAVFEEVLAKAKKIDGSLERAVLGIQAQTSNSLEKLEKKLIRAEKNNNENTLNQIRSVKDKLFPDNGLQERRDTFLSFYSIYGDNFLAILLENIDVLEKRFVVLIDN